MYTYPDSSPWGEIQTCHELCPGAFQVTTAGHGGIMVNSKAAKHILSDAARACAFREGAFICFEEDCDGAVALRELLDKGLYSAPANYEPGEFSDLINRSLREYNPDYWRAREATRTSDLKSDKYWYYITNEASGNRDRPSIRSKLKTDAARKDSPASPEADKKKDSPER